MTATDPALVALIEQRFSEQHARMDRQDASLDRVEGQVRLTNGRVSALEHENEYRATVARQRRARASWVMSLVQAIVAGLVLAAIVTAFNLHGG